MTKENGKPYLDDLAAFYSKRKSCAHGSSKFAVLVAICPAPVWVMQSEYFIKSVKFKREYDREFTNVTFINNVKADHTT